MAASLALHEQTWQLVDGFFVLHEFARRYLEAVGISPDRVHIKSNMVPDRGPAAPRASGFVYAGRLEVSKGLPLLLDAWARAFPEDDAKLTIAGDGPLRDYVANRSVRLRNVDFVGRVDRTRVLQLIDGAGAVIVPSLWFEGAPLLVSEGASRGRPAIVTRMGGLPELVGKDRGWVAEPTGAGLAAALRTAHATPDHTWHEMSRASRQWYCANSSATAVLGRLLELYEHSLRHAL